MMELLDEGMDTFNIVVSIAKYAPGIGSAATVVKTALTAARSTFDSALDRVRTVEDIVGPMNDVAEAGIVTCTTGKMILISDVGYAYKTRSTILIALIFPR